MDMSVSGNYCNVIVNLLLSGKLVLNFLKPPLLLLPRSKNGKESHILCQYNRKGKHYIGIFVFNEVFILFMNMNHFVKIYK